ncbi:MAG: hypothetical protein IPL39_01415 [Opitutaceae bacterium]|nr:hypothetical protein [Opitutaceae bacterium]
MTTPEIKAARDGQRPFSDLPWLCRDADGEIAVFESAGFGQIPSEVFSSLDAYLAALPIICEALADRSHYIFDYQDAGWLDRSKAYVLVSPPLPLVARVDLRGCPQAVCEAVRFRDIQQFRVDDYFKSTNV